MVESVRVSGGSSPFSSTAVNVDKAMHTPGSGTVGVPSRLALSVRERAGPSEGD